MDLISFIHFLTHPFIEYGFLRRAWVACIALSLSSGAVGCMLILRRMALVGDALSHAVLPGVAIGFLVSGGFSLVAMCIGGLIAGLLVVVSSSLVSRHTVLYEDASLAGFYLTSMSLGVCLISARGSNIDLMHILFGSLLSIDSDIIFLIGITTSLTLLFLALLYRPLVLMTLDNSFFRNVQKYSVVYHLIFMVIVAINLVIGFVALGTIMSVGMLILPAILAHIWCRSLPRMLLVCAFSGVLSGYIGLMISYYFSVSAGPCVILVLGIFYFISAVVMRRHA